MYLDSSGFKDMDPPFSYTPNTWYYLKFNFDCNTDTYDIYINDVLRKSGAGMRIPSLAFDQVWFLCDYGFVCTAYADNVIITEIVANVPPNIPSNPSPLNGATNVDVTADLSWTGGDPDGDTVTYDVYLGNASSPPLIAANLPTTTYDPGQLRYSSTYYWKIVARDEHGAETTGPIWNFQTKIVICGDANGDGIVDISDAVYLISYIFAGGPAPNPLCSGDANGDGSVDISDCVYLIAYIFSGGPAPVPNCCE
jgi:hypothetical protein